MEFKKRGQEEMAGFAMLLILVAIIGIAFLAIFIRSNNSSSLSSLEVQQFTESVMQSTTECSLGIWPALISYSDLIDKCYNNQLDKCSTGQSPCEYIQSTLPVMISSVWNIAPNSPYSGARYNLVFKDSISGEEKVFSEKAFGDCTGDSMGGESILPDSNKKGNFILRIGICLSNTQSSSSISTSTSLNNGSFNIDFGASSSTKSGAAVAGNIGDFWNSVKNFNNSDYSVSNLKFADGSQSAISVRVQGLPYNWTWQSAINDKMFNSYLFSHNSDGKITLTNIPEGTYDIYIYGHGAQDTQKAVFQLKSGALSLGEKQTSSSNKARTSTSWQEQAHYVKFSGIAVKSGESVEISIPQTTVGPTSFSLINGLQFVKYSV